MNTNENVATHANITTLVINYRQITGKPYFCRPVDDDVGDYICSYNDFQQRYPEYFI